MSATDCVLQAQHQADQLQMTGMGSNPAPGTAVSMHMCRLFILQLLLAVMHRAVAGHSLLSCMTQCYSLSLIAHLRITLRGGPGRALVHMLGWSADPMSEGVASVVKEAVLSESGLLVTACFCTSMSLCLNAIPRCFAGCRQQSTSAAVCNVYPLSCMQWRPLSAHP